MAGRSGWIKRVPALGQVNVMVLDNGVGVQGNVLGNVLVSFHLGECLGALEERAVEVEPVYGEGEGRLLMNRGNSSVSWEDFTAASNAMLEMELRIWTAVHALQLGEADDVLKESALRMWSMNIPELVLNSWPDLLHGGPLRVFKYRVDLDGHGLEDEREARLAALEGIKAAVLEVFGDLDIKCGVALVGRGHLGGLKPGSVGDGWGDEESFASVLLAIEKENIAISALPGKPGHGRMGI